MQPEGDDNKEWLRQQDWKKANDKAADIYKRSHP